MILKLTEAQAIDPAIKQGDLDAFETSIRELTHNKFQKVNVRASNLTIENYTIELGEGTTLGMRVGDTIEINDTLYNDGLYVIKTLGATTITIDEVVAGSKQFISETAKDAIVTLVHYPADIVKGVKSLIEYDLKMADKVGIKSETISRMSVTYYDVNATDNAEGYPKALLDFIRKYEKMRWG